jgi:hypothetical protein
MDLKVSNKLYLKHNTPMPKKLLCDSFLKHKKNELCSCDATPKAIVTV